MLVGLQNQRSLTGEVNSTDVKCIEIHSLQNTISKDAQQDKPPGCEAERAPLTLSYKPSHRLLCLLSSGHLTHVSFGLIY